MRTATDYARIAIAAFSLSCSGAPAFANFSMSPSGTTTLFAIDAANQGTSACAAASTECGATVPINTAGAPLFTAAVPGVISQPNTTSVTNALALGAANTFVINTPNRTGTIGVTITGLSASGATLTLEASEDNGASWVTANCVTAATGSIATDFAADNSCRVNQAGRSNLRLRVSSTGSGSANIAYTASSATGGVFLSAPVPAGTNAIGTVTAVGAAATGATLAGNPVRVGLSDGTNAQNWLTALSSLMGDGVNGNNIGTVAPWVWNGATWDRMPGTAANGIKAIVTNGGTFAVQNTPQAPPLDSKTAAATITAQNATVAVVTQGAASAIFTITAIANGPTIKFQGLDNQATWYDIPAWEAGTGTVVAAGSTVNANGKWLVPVGGWQQARAIITSATGGQSATIAAESGVGGNLSSLILAAQSTATVQGAAASGASVSGNPLYFGARAQSAEATAVTGGQAVGLAADLVGKLITMPYANKENMIRGASSGTSGAITVLAASGNAAWYDYVTAVQCSNTSASTVFVTLNDSVSTILIVPAGSGNNSTYPVPLRTALNTALTATMSGAATTVYCNAQGYTGT